MHPIRSHPGRNPYPAQPTDRRPIRRRRVALLAGLAALAGPLVAVSGVASTTAIAGAAGTAGGVGEPIAFGAVGTAEVWTAPPYAQRVHIRAVGGSGSDGNAMTDGGRGGGGGLGATVEADLLVTPGERLTIQVGGAGTSAAPGLGAFPGGKAGDVPDDFGFKAGRGNGGAATVVSRQDGTVAVAAGGGGGGGAASFSSFNEGNGGDGGAGGGYRGYYGSGDLAGAGGEGSSGRQAGGDGGDSSGFGEAGGGGGGGGGYRTSGTGGGAGGKVGGGTFYGGGAGGGGAGGASYATDPAAAFGISNTRGDGSVTITWLPYLPTRGTIGAGPTALVMGASVDLTADVWWDLPLPLPSGIVTFGRYDIDTRQDVVLGTLPILHTIAQLRDGAAHYSPSLTTNQLTPGVDYLWVSYSGDATHQPWKSASVEVVVSPAVRTVAVNPASLDFSAQPIGSTTTKSVTITNTGNVSWVLGSLSLASPAYRIVGGTCASGPVPPSASCTLSVSFVPTATAPTNDTLLVSDTVGNLARIPLSGSLAVSVTPGGPPPAPGPPSISAISPASGLWLGGTFVTITGTNLVNVTGVVFGNRYAPQFSCPTSTTCTAVSPSGSGTVDLRVMTPAGISPIVAGDRFRYL